jgi:hypothetical protein
LCSIERETQLQRIFTVKTIKIVIIKGMYEKGKEFQRRLSESKLGTRPPRGKVMVTSMYIPKDCRGKVLGEAEWHGSSTVTASITHWMYIELPKE